MDLFRVSLAFTPLPVGKFTPGLQGENEGEKDQTLIKSQPLLTLGLGEVLADSFM